MQKIWLWTVLGFNYDVRASVGPSQRIKVVIVDSYHVDEKSGSRVRSRGRVICSIRGMGEIGLHLDSDTPLM